MRSVKSVSCAFWLNRITNFDSWVREDLCCHLENLQGGACIPMMLLSKGLNFSNLWKHLVPCAMDDKPTSSSPLQAHAYQADILLQGTQVSLCSPKGPFRFLQLPCI